MRAFIGAAHREDVEDLVGADRRTRGVGGKVDRTAGIPINLPHRAAIRLECVLRRIDDFVRVAFAAEIERLAFVERDELAHVKALRLHFGMAFERQPARRAGGIADLVVNPIRQPRLAEPREKLAHDREIRRIRREAAGHRTGNDRAGAAEVGQSVDPRLLVRRRRVMEHRPEAGAGGGGSLQRSGAGE